MHSIFNNQLQLLGLQTGKMSVQLG